MLGNLETFFETTSFMAHGYCLTWRSDLIALHAISDALIFLSYFIIPLALFYFVLRRTDLAHKSIFWLFAAFILACGTTHLVGLVTLWNPVYGLEGVVKAGTAGISVLTAFAAWLIIPQALRLPSPTMLREANEQLVSEVDSHTRTNQELLEIRAELEQRVALRTRELEKKAAELESANESLRQFAHIASHDLQEPLRKIASYVDILEQSLAEGDAEEAHMASGRLRAMSTRARGMVGDLLRFSKLSQRAANLQSVNLEAAFTEVADLFEDELAFRGGQLEIDLPKEPVLADPMLVGQIFQNLLGNALKYVPRERPPVLFVRSSATENGLKLDLGDNGIGFDPSLKNRIFEPFTRLHGRSVADGSGIGLAIVARAIAALGWSIDVDSREGEGTTFSIRLPVSRETYRTDAVLTPA